MKIFLLAALALAAGLTVAPVTFAQSGGGNQASPPPKPLPSADPSFDLGKVEGSTYTNEHFGISFTAPKGWTILDSEVMKAMRENAKGLFRDEKNTKVKSNLEASVERTTPLFSASKLPPGTAGSFNAVLICAVERIPTAVVKTPLDYYTTLLRSINLSEGVDLEVVEPFKTKRIGVTDFGVYTLKVTSNVGIVMQKHIIMIKAPYTFAIVFNYADESDARTFDEVVNSIRAN